MCADCRKRANAIGASVVAQLPTAQQLPQPQPVEPRAIDPRTPGQNRAYHKKIALLASQSDQSLKAVKAAALAHISEQLNRDVASSSDLDELEMSDLLDWLDAQIDD